MIVNFGSINVDHVYRVEKLPEPGETLSAYSHEKFLGGKGINQSIAIVKAGGDVKHFGAVGIEDGDWALSEIEAFGVDTASIARVEALTGHAVIYVDTEAENEIVILGGANQALRLAQIDEAFEDIAGVTCCVIQNETNLTKQIAEHANEVGVPVVYAAAPFVAARVKELIDTIDVLAVNEVEAAEVAELLGCEIAEIPVPELLVTLGRNGANYLKDGEWIEQQAFVVQSVDTTGAGDCFLGAFLAGYFEKRQPLEDALRFAAASSALQVTKPGAAVAIPEKEEVFAFLDLLDGKND